MGNTPAASSPQRAPPPGLRAAPPAPPRRCAPDAWPLTAMAIESADAADGATTETDFGDAADGAAFRVARATFGRPPGPARLGPAVAFREAATYPRQGLGDALATAHWRWVSPLPDHRPPVYPPVYPPNYSYVYPPNYSPAGFPGGCPRVVSPR